MPGRLSHHEYGKSGIRLMKVVRGSAAHEVCDLTVHIRFQGRFAGAYVAGDNRWLYPTDTMKNVVYTTARGVDVDPPEEFALALTRCFFERVPAADRVTVEIEANRWKRLGAHGFRRESSEKRVAALVASRDRDLFEAGVTGLSLLKTADSAFEGFARDDLTTLPGTRDRLIATEVAARWRYGPIPRSFSDAFQVARGALIATFIDRPSRSVQETLYAMGEAALAACPEMEEIRLELPNLHHPLVDLTSFGLENPNQVFAPITEPRGVIAGTITRA